MRAWALMLALASFLGCGDSVGGSGRTVGGACTTDRDCDRLCLTGSSHYPGGMCTLRCVSDHDCPESTACIDDAGGVCAVLCRGAAECSDFGRGYTCDSEHRIGAPGDAFVCRVP